MSPFRRPDPFLGGPWFSAVDIRPWKPGIEPSEPFYFAGSCFAENLYRVWRDNFLPGRLSPFGSTYNPVSLASTVRTLCKADEIREDEIFLHKGLWRHSLFNTLASRPDKQEYLKYINSGIREHTEHLKKASSLVVTLGTAFVYKEMNPRSSASPAGSIVNNCHQRPASEFRRCALSIEEITGALEELGGALRTLNPDCSLILTLSPVRHLRDGATENSLSKALLRCGIDEYLKGNPKGRYFPSYEILLDELRDYRWYDSDLCHPSAEAASYITERFFKSAGGHGFHDYLREAGKIRALMDHQIRFPESKEALAFIKKRTARLNEFSARYPFALIN